MGKVQNFNLTRPKTLITNVEDDKANTDSSDESDTDENTSGSWKWKN